MTTTRERELAAFKDEQAALGGVEPSKLPHGAEIWIDTDKYMYRLTVDRTMGMPKFIIDTGSPLCPTDRICVSVSSHCQRLRYDMPDWLGKGMRLILGFADASNIITSEIQGVTVIGKTEDGSEYKYELWQ